MDRVNCPLCTGRRTTTSIAFPRVITMKSSRDESLFMRARLYPRLPRPPSSARNLARRYRAGLDSVSFVYSSLPLLFNFIVPWVTASQATKPYYEFHASRVKGPRYSDGAARFCRRRRRRWKICFSDRSSWFTYFCTRGFIYRRLGGERKTTAHLPENNIAASAPARIKRPLHF